MINGVEPESINGILGQDPVALESLSLDKENEVVENISGALQVSNVASLELPSAAESLSLSGVGTEGTAAVAPKNKSATLSKVFLPLHVSSFLS